MNAWFGQPLAAFSSALLGCRITKSQFLAVQDLLRSRPWHERSALPLAVLLLDLLPARSRPYRRFRSLPPDLQARWIERWSRTLPPPLARALAGIKSLAALAVYADAANWQAIRYDGPWLGRVPMPVLLERVPATEQPPSELMADVCVIGSGAGGAAAAARLAERGLDTIVLEAGPRTVAADYTQRELDMMARLYYERGLSGTTDQAITILRGRGLGGSTLHNTGMVVPPPPAIIERWRTDHGFDVSAAVLEKQVRHVFSALQAVPITEDRLNAANRMLLSGAQALGWRAYLPYHNRLECSGCGYCMIGCAYNRKMNAAASFLNAAAACGARLFDNVEVVRFTGRADDFVIEARAAGGQSTRVRARRVVVAAGALETPLVLQRSAVRSPALGRHLRLHPAPIVFARAETHIQAWRGLPQGVIVNEFASFEKDGRGGFLVLANAGTAPALTAAVSPAAGRYHRAFMHQYPELVSAAVLLHDEASGSVRAMRGRPSVRYWPDAQDTRTLLAGMQAVARLFFAAGAREVYLPFRRGSACRPAELDAAFRVARLRPHDAPFTSVHPQGTCALGQQRAQSVTRPTGEVWDAPGVYVSDASLFPTSIGVPPQVTIMALARVVADHVAESLGS